MAMKMTFKRSDKGFTMMEMMISIALLIIVAGLVFVNVIQYQRSFYQREMDETAKEIYIAAQNHLTVAESIGTLSNKTQGTPVSVPGGRTNEYYYVVPESKSLLNQRGNMLNVMLPQGSIDETVRSGGSYIIHYQCDNTTARVLDVFYANPSGQFGHTFLSSEYSNLLDEENDYCKMDNDGEAARGNYGGAIIGYYGGEKAADDLPTLPPPKLRINNADELTVSVANFDDFNSDVEFMFYITGETSGALSNNIKLDAARGATSNIVIDSVTRPNLHFAQLESANDIAFIPGENIKIQVFASSPGAKVSKSSAQTTNSLFGSLSAVSISGLIGSFLDLPSGEPTLFSAKISNIRHLENLDNDISGYTEYTEEDGVRALPLGSKTPDSYQQTTTLSWSTFGGGSAQIYKLDDSTGTGSFIPVDVNYDTKFEYEGNGRSITGVVVDGADDAGLFGTLAANSTVRNLELINFDVSSSDNVNAGALAGSMASGATVANVFVHEVNGSSTISGSSAVGGLVGNMVGGTINGCAAAVIVDGGTAGGLVGNASGGTIANSYSGGHTSNGAYTDDANVTGSAIAGGLVGSSTAAISYCYSTCSVAGETAGGFVGQASSGSVQNCYAVGKVSNVASDKSDPFAGSTGATFSGNQYLQIVNMDPSNAEETRGANGASAADSASADNSVSSTDNYKAFALGTKDASPYDAKLTETYNGKYDFKTIEQLNSGYAAALAGLGVLPSQILTHLTMHYGDWPAVETLIVNQEG